MPNRLGDSSRFPMRVFLMVLKREIDAKSLLQSLLLSAQLAMDNVAGRWSWKLNSPSI